MYVHGFFSISKSMKTRLDDNNKSLYFIRFLRTDGIGFIENEILLLHASMMLYCGNNKCVFEWVKIPSGFIRDANEVKKKALLLWGINHPSNVFVSCSLFLSLFSCAHQLAFNLELSSKKKSRVPTNRVFSAICEQRETEKERSKKTRREQEKKIDTVLKASLLLFGVE